jgi:hypothetical protein
MEVPCDCREARVRQWNGSLLKVTAAIDNNRVVGRLEELGTPVMIETGPDKSREGKVFLETGHYLKGPFARYWEQQGGLGQYGLPITGEMIEPDPQTGRARVVQYFERNRFDYFPEFANTAYEVQIGRLGDVALQRKGIDWQTLPKRTAADEGCLFFAQSGHQLCPPFRDRWEKAGGLARNGLPLTEAYTDTDRLIQFFERSRFEAHPENQPPWDIQLGLLSRELYGSWGRWR